MRKQANTSRTSAVLSLSLVAGLVSGCTALLGDFTPGAPVDAGPDGYEGSAAKDAGADGTVPRPDGASASAGDAESDGASSTAEGGHVDAADAEARDTGAPLCSVGETYCAPVCSGSSCPCVNEKTDPNNCGGCGKVCSASEPACVDGGCGCVDVEQLCPSGLLGSGPLQCTDVRTDPNNCGTCGHQCSAAGSQNKNCIDGGCTCSPYC